MQNPVKFELFQVTYSEVGFRNHRDCFYRLRVKYPDGKCHYMFYSTYSDLLSFLKLVKRAFK